MFAHRKYCPIVDFCILLCLSALWIIISWLAWKFLMVSFSSTLFCWWLIYFLLHKLVIPLFIEEIYWLSLSQWSSNERFLSCLDISVLSCVLSYTVLLLLVAIPVSYRKTTLGRKFLKNRNKLPINLSLLYPGVSGQKFKPFSKTDFPDGETCFSMWNKIDHQNVWLFVMVSFY